MSRTLDLVRENVKAGRIRVSEHCMAELSDDDIDLKQVIDGLASARAIEDYPDYHKGPSVLCIQYDADNRAIHVLWGVALRNRDVATVITAYRPDPTKWDADLVTRRRR